MLYVSVNCKVNPSVPNTPSSFQGYPLTIHLFHKITLRGRRVKLYIGGSTASGGFYKKPLELSYAYFPQ